MNNWTALAVGAGLGSLAYAALMAAGHWIRAAINRQTCPLCGHQPAIPPGRTLADGVRQLKDQLDQQKGQQ